MSKSAVYLLATISLLNICITLEYPNHQVQPNLAHEGSTGIHATQEHPAVVQPPGPLLADASPSPNYDLLFARALTTLANIEQKYQESTGKKLYELNELGILDGDLKFTPENIENPPCNMFYHGVNTYCEETCRKRHGPGSKGSCDPNDKKCHCQDQSVKIISI